MGARGGSGDGGGRFRVGKLRPGEQIGGGRARFRRGFSSIHIMGMGMGESEEDEGRGERGKRSEWE